MGIVMTHNYIATNHGLFLDVQVVLDSSWTKLTQVTFTPSRADFPQDATVNHAMAIDDVCLTVGGNMHGELLGSLLITSIHDIISKSVMCPCYHVPSILIPNGAVCMVVALRTHCP